jgi:alpha-D-ribose 1-methylphosphonate 5-triphosphate diphosphatase PhnM
VESKALIIFLNTKRDDCNKQRKYHEIADYVKYIREKLENRATNIAHFIRKAQGKTTKMVELL